MTSDSHRLRLDTIVGPFAELLLTADLPDLPADRRAAAVAFVERRADGVPSFTRFGLALIAAFYRALLAVPGGDRFVTLLASKPVPVVGEYPRLVRSLAYAYIWERWPDTSPTGGSC